MLRTVPSWTNSLNCTWLCLRAPQRHSRGRAPPRAHGGKGSNGARSGDKVHAFASGRIGVRGPAKAGAPGCGWVRARVQPRVEVLLHLVEDVAAEVGEPRREREVVGALLLGAAEERALEHLVLQRHERLAALPLEPVRADRVRHVAVPPAPMLHRRVPCAAGGDSVTAAAAQPGVASQTSREPAGRAFPVGSGHEATPLLPPGTTHRRGRTCASRGRTSSRGTCSRTPCRSSSRRGPPGGSGSGSRAPRRGSGAGCRRGPTCGWRRGRRPTWRCCCGGP